MRLNLGGQKPVSHKKAQKAQNDFQLKDAKNLK